jgi:hypothetical protein
MDIVPGMQGDAVASAARSNWSAWTRTLSQAAAVFVVCAGVFAFVQFGTSALVDNDAYYHTKMGLLIRQQGLTPSFIWLPMTILNRDAFYDHHMLYHVYLSFFAGDGQAQSLILGAKIASILMPSLAFVAIWWLLHGQGIRWAAIWTLGLFGLSQAFLFRMSMTRAQSASLLLLVLGMHWLLRRRYALLIPLGFVYVWLYNAFPMLLVFAAIYVVATLLTERQLAWQALAAPAIGIALGLIVNPYFPRDFQFIIDHLVPKVGSPTTSVGNEWYPYDTWTLLANSGFALAAWVLGALALGWRDQRINRPTLTAFGISVIMGFLLFKSRRFIEYFPPFALIFAALGVAPLIDVWVANRTRWQQRLAPAMMLVALAISMVIMVPQARTAMSQSMPSDTYAAASAWLREHSPPGSMVFQTDWDDFPLLFFYNTSNIYTVGLDPTFMESYDANRYAEWVKITRGEIKLPGRLIRSDFGARYVLTDLQHQAFIAEAKSDPYLKEVYRDQYAVVFSVTE